MNEDLESKSLKELREIARPLGIMYLAELKKAANAKSAPSSTVLQFWKTNKFPLDFSDHHLVDFSYGNDSQ